MPRQKQASNLRKALMDVAQGLKTAFGKHTRNTRSVAWQRMTSPKGEKEVRKLIINPNRQLSIFAKLTFKEWLEHSERDH